MEIETEAGTHKIERKRGAEQFFVEIQFYEPGGELYSVEKMLGALVDKRVTGRSDIDEETARNAINTLLEKIRDELGSEIDGIRSVEIVSRQALRKTPYDDRESRSD